MHIFFPNYEHHRHRATHSVEEAAAQHGRGGDPVGGSVPESRESQRRDEMVGVTVSRDALVRVRCSTGLGLGARCATGANASSPAPGEGTEWIGEGHPLVPH